MQPTANPVAENMVATVRLLVVSREPAILRSVWSIGEINTWQVETAPSGWDAMERVQAGVAPDLLLLDLPRGDGDSLHILRWLRRLRPELRVLVLCHPEDGGRNKEATRLGALDVLVRPFSDEQLERSIRQHVFEPENRSSTIVSEDIEQLGQEAFFVSASAIMQRLRAQAELLAQADVPVLILGEGGSGRSTVARLIHKLSVRSGFRFLKVDCGAVPGDMLEEELFGNDRPFSNGHKANSGKFELGEKGTIFLDEITEMPLSLQARLLEILHDKAFVRASGDRPVPVDVHILAATSANIERALAEKKLREDLYYRLSAFTVHVPPLRQRREEISVLLRHLMHKLARHYGLPPREFSPNVLDACQDYAWPGNLIELETFVKRYLVAGDQELTFGDNDLAAVSGNGKGRLRGPQTLRFASTQGHSSDDNSELGPKSLKSLVQSVKCEAERNAIGAALERTGWNRKAAARLLDVSYRTLLYKIEQYRMTASDPFLSPLPAERMAQNNGAKNGKLS